MLLTPDSFDEHDVAIVAALEQQNPGRFPYGALLDGYLMVPSVTRLHPSGAAQDREWFLIDKMPDVPLSMKLGNVTMLALELIARSPGAVHRLSEPYRRRDGDPAQEF